MKYKVGSPEWISKARIEELEGEVERLRENWLEALTRNDSLSASNVRLQKALGQCGRARAELAANLSAVLSDVDLDYERSMDGTIWVERGVSYARPKIAVRDIEQAQRVLEQRP